MSDQSDLTTNKPGVVLTSVVRSVALALFAISVPVYVSGHGIAVVPAFVLVLAHCACIPLMIRWPGIAIGVSSAAACALSVLAHGASDAAWPWSVPGLLTQLGVIAVAGSHGGWGRGLAAWLLSATVSVALVLVLPVPVEDWGANLTVFASNSVLVLVVSVLAGQRSAIRAELTHARHRAELEQASRVLTQERSRIARELHDVVAHSMSVIQVQARSAAYRLPQLDDPTRREFDSIADATRTALAEMRQVLTVLRDQHAGTEVVPQPRLEDVADLVAAVTRAGVDARLHVDGDLTDEAISVPIGLTAYRIVQEALANAVRHAHGAPIDVSLDVVREELSVEVVNGPGLAGRPGDPLATGQGLVGMRERAALLGGRVRAEPTDDGGFLVRGTIPLTTGRW